MTLRLAAVVAALALCLPARAQQNPDAFTLPVERFRPAIDDKGLATTESGAIPSHLGFQTGLLLNYALNPLVIRDNNNVIVGSIVSHRVAGDALFTIGLFDYVSVGVDLPMTFLQLGGQITNQALADATGVSQGLAGVGIGDLKLVPKVRILREDRHFISLAIIPALTLPTAGGLKSNAAGQVSYDYGGSYLGEGPGRFAFIPELAVSTNIQGFRLAGNLAYRLRQPVRFLGALDINPEFVYRAGVGYDLSTTAVKMNNLLLFAEIFGATPDRNPFGLFTDQGNLIAKVDARLTNPLEWAAGARYRVWGGVNVEGGFGTGILPGYGSPDLRVFLGVRYGVEDNDKDNDGIVDSDDKCPEDPEDKDGFQDTDGCPDPDNDGDGLPDAADKCPNEAEDKDGYQDDDGCPDPDNDGDGVLDGEDKCPNEPGEKAYAGCPAPDRDKDTVPDAKDLCPDVPGKVELGGCPDRDGDGIEDDKDKCPDQPGPAATGGCPDKDGDGIVDASDRCPDNAGPVDLKGCPDRDKDGIPDIDDKCPDEPETINGFQDDDGCPDKGVVLVTVTKEKIELNQTVFFDTGKASIKPVSFTLLDAVAQVMKAHGEIKKILVEGHTDDQGPDDFNMDLSKRRAASVMTYLIDHGITGERLASEGYGETKPIADNKTKSGREKNRRVELKILEQE